MTEIYYVGKEYWQVCRRFHANRDANAMVRPAALNDMARIRDETESNAVRRRVNSFIAKHQRHPPGGTPFGRGPSVA